MTGGFVADSSVGIAWAARSQSSPDCDDLLTEISKGRPFVVPGLWMMEVANALLVLARRKKITTEDCESARRFLAALVPQIDEEATTLALSDIYCLAENHSLTIYDAVYLELAIRRNLPLASRDTSLRKAANRCGVDLLPKASPIGRG